MLRNNCRTRYKRSTNWCGAPTRNCLKLFHANLKMRELRARMDSSSRFYQTRRPLWHGARLRRSERQIKAHLRQHKSASPLCPQSRSGTKTQRHEKCANKKTHNQKRFGRAEVGSLNKFGGRTTHTRNRTGGGELRVRSPDAGRAACRWAV